MAPGTAGLVRRQIALAPGSRLAGTAGSGGELWFVIHGSGRLEAGAQRGAPVGRDTGLRIPPRARYRLDAVTGVLLDVVALPAWNPGPSSGPPGTGAAGGASAGSGLPGAEGVRAARLGDCQVEQTGDRRFRVLLGPGRGCEAATQFVGEIPPGRAPEHSHPYDELVLVLGGEGVAHVAGTGRPLAPGTRVDLPRGLLHCLENTGQGPLVVLGVFHPGGSPAAKTARTPARTTEVPR